MIQSSVEQAAGQLAQVFAAQGIDLPTVKESSAKADQPGIYLGNTQFADRNGVSLEPDSG